MKKDLLLKDYNPVSMLCLKEHEVTNPKFPVFDAHIHIGALQMERKEAEKKLNVAKMVKSLKKSGICGVVNLKMFWGDMLKSHLKMLEGYEEYIHTFASVDVSRLDEPDFAKSADEELKQFKAMGIKGLKFWKNIGCTLKDSNGKYIRANDSRLFPIWEAAAKYGLPVLYHIADPKAFFTPVDEKNEFYEALVENPEWSFYDSDGEGRYTFEQLMQQQDNLLTENPDTTFIIPHVGSCAEDLSWVGSQLDKHPNMYIDTAARNNLLGRQPYTARDFFLKYQDRILFGTDFGFDNETEDKNTFDFYADHYRLFETYDEYFRPVRNWGWGQGRWNIYGICLPDDVLKKFYAGNAIKLLKIKI